MSVMEKDPGHGDAYYARLAIAAILAPWVIGAILIGAHFIL